MEFENYQALRAVLPDGRSLYAYYKDRYSLQLLRYAVREATPVARLREHAVARLLDKPRVKQVLSRCGKTLTPAQIALADGDPAAEAYLLSIANWGATPGFRVQMSRRGTNLVLQLNFSQAHNRRLRRLLDLAGEVDPFNVGSHPVHRDARHDRRYTLAWARLDIDLDGGEALIEEIQSDWVRAVARLRMQVEKCGELADWYRQRSGIRAEARAVVEYDETLLAPHRAVWAEAMLSAALFFLREELGIGRVWMHTPESGLVLKRMRRQGCPPSSLYSDLPERFCFQRSRNLPAFLAREREVARQMRRRPGLQLHTLTF